MLPGLTIVLIDGSAALKYERGLNVAMEAFFALREAGGDVRIFTVTNRLMELQETPESFGPMYSGPIRLSNAVNRVNITRPRRIVVLAGEYNAPLEMPREGTNGYLWSEWVLEAPRLISERWRIVESVPAGIVHEIARIEQEAGRGVQQTTVR